METPFQYIYPSVSFSAGGHPVAPVFHGESNGDGIIDQGETITLYHPGSLTLFHRPHYH